MINSDLKIKKIFSNERGFTLLELITVSIIIGILATMSVSLVSRARVNAKESAAVATLNSFAGAWESYWSRHGTYPQWGEGQRFSNPQLLMRTMVREGYLPRPYSGVPYDPATGRFYRLTDDYALEIYEFDDGTGTRSESDYYWILLHPIGFQKTQGYLGIGKSSDGKIAVKPRASFNPGDINSFTIYGLHRKR